MRTLIVSMIASLAIFSSATTVAKTPDGVTPANEGACDSVKPWRNLYGLCVAFCEAQDLSDVDLNDPESVAKSSPNPEILARYKERQGTGPGMPCMNSEPTGGGDDPPPPPGEDDPPPPPEPVGDCPCWTADELGAIDGSLPEIGSSPYMACVSNTDDAGNVYENQVSEGYEGFFGREIARLAFARNTSGYEQCVYEDAPSNTELSMDLSLEPGAAAACVSAITAQCASYDNPQ